MCLLWLHYGFLPLPYCHPLPAELVAGRSCFCCCCCACSWTLLLLLLRLQHGALLRLRTELAPVVYFSPDPDLSAPAVAAAALPASSRLLPLRRCNAFALRLLLSYRSFCYARRLRLRLLSHWSCRTLSLRATSATIDARWLLPFAVRRCSC